jgi:hypothetical protein
LVLKRRKYILRVQARLGVSPIIEVKWERRINDKLIVLSVSRHKDKLTAAGTGCDYWVSLADFCSCKMHGCPDSGGKTIIVSRGHNLFMAANQLQKPVGLLMCGLCLETIKDFIDTYARQGENVMLIKVGRRSVQYRLVEPFADFR